MLLSRYMSKLNFNIIFFHLYYVDRHIRLELFRDTEVLTTRIVNKEVNTEIIEFTYYNLI